jgi:hypothetical protein
MTEKSRSVELTSEAPHEDRHRVTPRVVKQDAGAGRAAARQPQMVDLISEAMEQNRRRAAMPRIIKQEKAPKPESFLSNWPPERWRQWRLETLTPWRLKSWKFKDWD